MGDKIGRENNQTMQIKSVGHQTSPLPDADLPQQPDGFTTGGPTRGNPDDEKKELCDLLERIVDQDQLAFSTLYEIMLARVYSVAFRITRCIPTAEEVAEDTFWQVWRQAPRFDPLRGSAVAWILTIARSRALDALRQQDNPVADREDGVEWAAPETHNPIDLLAAVQEGSRLYAALATLEPATQQVLTLAFFRGLTHDEIARHSGLPLGTVKSLIRRALLHLKQTLAATPENETP